MFSIKSCYITQALDRKLEDPDVEQEKSIKGLWRAKVSIKFETFCWRLFLNRFPSKDQLSRRGVIDDNHEMTYVLCFQQDENLDHLILSCPTMQKVWFRVNKFIGFLVSKEGTSWRSFSICRRNLTRNIREDKEGILWLETYE